MAITPRLTEKLPLDYGGSSLYNIMTACIERGGRRLESDFVEFLDFPITLNASNRVILTDEEALSPAQGFAVFITLPEWMSFIPFMNKDGSYEMKFDGINDLGADPRLTIMSFIKGVLHLVVGHGHNELIADGEHTLTIPFPANHLNAYLKVSDAPGTSDVYDLVKSSIPYDIQCIPVYEHQTIVSRVHITPILEGTFDSYTADVYQDAGSPYAGSFKPAQSAHQPGCVVTMGGVDVTDTCNIIWSEGVLTVKIDSVTADTSITIHASAALYTISLPDKSTGCLVSAQSATVTSGQSWSCTITFDTSVYYADSDTIDVEMDGAGPYDVSKTFMQNTFTITVYRATGNVAITLAEGATTLPKYRIINVTYREATGSILKPEIPSGNVVRPTITGMSAVYKLKATDTSIKLAFTAGLHTGYVWDDEYGAFYAVGATNDGRGEIFRFGPGPASGKALVEYIVSIIPTQWPEARFVSFSVGAQELLRTHYSINYAQESLEYFTIDPGPGMPDAYTVPRGLKFTVRLNFSKGYTPNDFRIWGVMGDSQIPDSELVVSRQFNPPATLLQIKNPTDNITIYTTYVPRNALWQS